MLHVNEAYSVWKPPKLDVYPKIKSSMPYATHKMGSPSDRHPMKIRTSYDSDIHVMPADDPYRHARRLSSRSLRDQLIPQFGSASGLRFNLS